jgi:hypothetical protein
MGTLDGSGLSKGVWSKVFKYVSSSDALVTRAGGFS